MANGKNTHLELKKEERFKKGVGAIHTSGTLTLIQRKLANVLLYAAYDDLLKKRTHKIPVSLMCAMLGWNESNRIDYLKEALSALQRTTLQFNLREDGKEVWESMTMLSYATIKDGVCIWRYDESLAEKLYKPDVFAMINLRVQNRIDSAYALNLYENCLRYKSTKTTGFWDLGLFREIMGVQAGYCDDFRYLNRTVIKPAIEKVNKLSDINISVEYVRKGRSVAGLKFFVHEKSDEEKEGMQSNLPGMSFEESVDGFLEFRNTKAFKELVKHGISEMLAVAWIKEKGEDAILDLIKYTEERDEKNLIKSNTRTYISHLIKSGATVGKSEYEKEKERKAKEKYEEEKEAEALKKEQSLRDEFRRHLISKKVSSLSSDELRLLAKKFIEENPEKRASAYNEENASFSGYQKTSFSIWLRTNVDLDDFTEENFKIWMSKNPIKRK